MSIYLEFISPCKGMFPVSKEAYIHREQYGFNVIIESDQGTFTCGPDITVSRKHLWLYRKGIDWYIRDLGSLNGTKIDGKIIEGWNEHKPSNDVKITLPVNVLIGLSTLFRITSSPTPKEYREKLDYLTILQEVIIEAQNAILAIRDRSGSRLKSSLEILSRQPFSNVISDISQQILESIKGYCYELNHSFQSSMSNDNFLRGINETMNILLNEASALRRIKCLNIHF